MPSLHDINYLIWNNSLDILLVCETWLGDCTSDELLNIDHFNIYRTDRNSRGKGLCVSVKNSLRFEVIQTRQDFGWEQLWIKLTTRKRKFAIGVVYKPHNQNTNGFLDDFEDSLIDIRLVVDQIVCMGDFNLDLLGLENNEVKKFNLILESLSLSQIIDVPTRVTATSATLLDYVIVQSDAEVEKGIIHSNI